MHRRILIAAGIAGALAVTLGAFGAHGLEKWLETLADGAKRRAWWDTATDYLFWQALLMMGLGLFARDDESRAVKLAALFNGAGMLLFSGSLYLMTLTGVRKLGMITPFGGTAFIAAWVALAIAARQRELPRQER